VTLRTLVWGLVSHHALATAVGILTLVFASSVLRQRRPTGSAAAWLLLIVLLPYLGIPLYLSFGGRKLQRRARRKVPLASSSVTSMGPSGHGADAGSAQFAPASVEWLVDGVQAYQVFLEQIRAARTSIRIQTFLLGDDETGRSIVDELTQRAQEGVVVEVLLDDLLARSAPKTSLERLIVAGGRVARFMPLVHVPLRGRANLRNHRKVAVFDGERAIVGGMNLAQDYMGPEPTQRFRDLSLLLSGRSAPALEAIFLADWAFARGQGLTAPPFEGLTETGIQVVPSGPDCPNDPIYDALLNTLFRAERRFWVATPYFVPDEGLARALEIAVRRGVDVRVIVPNRSNHRLADLAAAPSLRELVAAGGNVQRYMPGMLHAKAVLVDESLAIVGSANFDMRSLFLDYEIALFLTGTAEVEQLSAWFESLATSTAPGAPQAGWLRAEAENVCRLLAPLI
jgi:cardiolipin synthase A/B